MSEGGRETVQHSGVNPTGPEHVPLIPSKLRDNLLHPVQLPSEKS